VKLLKGKANLHQGLRWSISVFGKKGPRFEPRRARDKSFSTINKTKDRPKNILKLEVIQKKG